MTDEDGHRIEAAEQFGFSQAEDDGPYTCAETQLIAFAKACERKGLSEAQKVAEAVSMRATMGHMPQGYRLGWSAGGCAIDTRLRDKITSIDAELAPILAAEEERAMTAAGYVRAHEMRPGTRWVKPVTLQDALKVSLQGLRK